MIMQHWRKLWPCLLLLALVVIFLGDVTFGNKFLFLRDVFGGDLAQRKYVATALWKGGSPFWNPYYQCGTPIAAQAYFGAFYPPNWILAFVSRETGLRLQLLFHLSVAAMSLYLLCRYWKLSATPALFAAITFTFSAYVTTWLEGNHGISCLVWSPLVLILAGRILDRAQSPGTTQQVLRDNGKFIAGLALVLALEFLASGEFFYYNSLLLAAYVGFRWFTPWSLRACTRSILCFGLAGGLATALVMPQLALTLPLLAMSHRSGVVDAGLDFASPHPRMWLTYLIPFLYGRPGYPDVYWGPKVHEFTSGSCYVGILPWLSLPFVALYSCRNGRQPERVQQTVFWILVLIFGWFMAAGRFTPLYPVLHHVLPGLGHFRFPAKFFLFATLALAMLGALGLQARLDSNSEAQLQLRRRLGRALMFGTGVFLLVYLASVLHPPLLRWLMAHPASPSGAQQRDVLVDWSIALGFAAIGLILLRLLTRPHSRTQIVLGAFVALSFINLVVVSRQIHPVVRAGIYDEVPEALSELARRAGTSRVGSAYEMIQQYLYAEKREDVLRWAKDAGATSDWGSGGIYEIRPGGMGLNRFERLHELLFNPRSETVNRVADLLCVRLALTGAPYEQILWGNAPRQLEVVERTNALPRAFLVAQWQTLAAPEAVLRVVLSDQFNPHIEAIIERAVAEAGVEPPVPSPASAGAFTNAVHSFRDLLDSVELEVRASQRALLVLADAWYPGWTATVDGIRAPIYRANYLFRGIFIEPGEHRIVFSYRPNGFRAGVVTCSLGAIACLALCGFSWTYPTLNRFPGTSRSDERQ